MSNHLHMHPNEEQRTANRIALQRQDWRTAQDLEDLQNAGDDVLDLIEMLAKRSFETAKDTNELSAQIAAIRNELDELKAISRANRIAIDEMATAIRNHSRQIAALQKHTGIESPPWDE